MPRTEWVCDGHVDLVYALQRAGGAVPFSGRTAGPVTPESLRAGSVGLLVNALYCADVHNGAGSAATHLAGLMAFAEARLDGLRRVTCAAELPEVAHPERPATLFLLENGDGLLESDLDALEVWGLRVVGLTHAGRNRLADGNGVAAPGGLSARGLDLLVELGRRRWVIDLAHLAEPGFWQVLNSYPGRLMTSHTGLRPFCDRARNLSVAQLDALAARDGMIGLTLAPEMLTGEGEAERADVVRQLDWLVTRYGPQQIAIGSDYDGFDGTCAGLEDYRSWPRLAGDLRRLGYPDRAVEEILGGNWLRFYRSTWEEALPGKFRTG